MAAKSTRHDSAHQARFTAAPRQIEVVYGIHAVEAALGNPDRGIVRLLATGNAARRLAPALNDRGLEAQIISPRELDRAAGPGAVHQGVVIEAEPLHQPHLDEIPRRGIVVVLDQVTDPHNVGAIMRSAAAFAATALVTTARHSPEGSAALAKAASGAIEWLPLVKVTNLARGLDELKGYGFTVLGLDSEAAAAIEDVRVSEPVALVLGAEGKGLRRLTRDTCDMLVRLDLPGVIKSLNVSNAAALALYALHRRA